ncbi:MAG: type II toxin-antitoxin system RelE/ParE family toxin [bacterium]|nr:type II toxin-antitoxin system RelE/ParE family toxin [bacterium]
MRLLPIRTGEWQILAVCTPRGDCPLLELLASSQGGGLARDARRMLRLLDRAARQGPPRNKAISHQLDREIWEFIQGQIRVLWFYDEGRMIVCSHGFVKKSRKVPRHDIEQAQERRRHYFDAKRRNELSIGG